MTQKISVKDMELPVVYKDATLFSPGVHNGLVYTPEAIRKAFEKTPWNNYTLSLYLDHRDNYIYNPATGQRDRPVDAEVRYYAGYVDNLRLERDDGIIRGDIYVTDLETALKLKLGAKFGISPAGKAYTKGKEVRDMVIQNWALVVNPAQKTTFLNAEDYGCYYAFAMREESVESANININIKNTEESKMEAERMEDKLNAELKTESAETEIAKETKIANAEEGRTEAELKEKSRKGKEEKEKKDGDKEEYPEPVEQAAGAGAKAKAKAKAKKKKYPEYPEYPEHEEFDDNLIEFVRSLSEEELSEWKQLVKKYGIKEAAKIYKKKVQQSKIEQLEKQVSELKAQLIDLSEKHIREDLGEPDMIRIKDSSNLDAMADMELDEVMADYFRKVINT